MKRVICAMLGSARRLVADMLGQILALCMFIAAGFAWLYFSTPYAVIPVIIVGVLVGGYFYGLVEGKGKAAKTKTQKKDTSNTTD